MEHEQLPNPNKRNSFSEKDISNTKRGQAISTVHFSSIFYCSRPFAAALTRTPFQVLYFVLGLLMCSDNRIRDVYIAFYGNNNHHSGHFRFDFHGCEKLNDLNIRPVLGKQEFSPDSYVVENSTYNLQFKSPVYFDGWIIHTPSELPACASSLWIKVFIKEEGIRGGSWKQVDSSSKVQITDKAVFLNGSFDLAKYRGGYVRFRASKQNVFGFILPEAVAGLYLGLLGVFGFAGIVKLASKLPLYNAIIFRENFRVRTFRHVHHLIKDASINGFQDEDNETTQKKIDATCAKSRLPSSTSL